MASHTSRTICLASIGLASILWLAQVAPSRADVDPLLVDRARAEILSGEAARGFALIRSAIDDTETPAASRADLYDALARLHLARGEFAAAADALTRQAALLATPQRDTAPELAGLYSRAADAYSRAGNHEAALAAARNAIRIDAIYYDCASDVLAEDHMRLAGSLAALGRAGLAAEERRLGEAPPAARCSGERSGRTARPPVVVTNDLGDADKNSFARVELFFATDRARSGSERPDDFYGSARGGMDYGTVEVTVPRTHKPGAIESPSIVKLEWTANPAAPLRHLQARHRARKTACSPTSRRRLPSASRTRPSSSFTASTSPSPEPPSAPPRSSTISISPARRCSSRGRRKATPSPISATRPWSA